MAKMQKDWSSLDRGRQFLNTMYYSPTRDNVTVRVVTESHAMTSQTSLGTSLRLWGVGGALRLPTLTFSSG